MLWTLDIVGCVVDFLLDLFIVPLPPNGLAIDCYHCTSLDSGTPACEDDFKRDITTEHFISRECYDGYWRGHFCVKLKGIRKSDGTSITVRQCSVKNWGSHCGLIQFEVGPKLEDIDGCLVSCDFDGCNQATINTSTFYVVWLTVIISLVGAAVLR